MRPSSNFWNVDAKKICHLQTWPVGFSQAPASGVCCLALESPSTESWGLPSGGSPGPETLRTTQNSHLHQGHPHGL